MAEQLGKYSSPGIGLKIPQVDFTASKVQAQTMASMAQSLDRMSNFFFKVAEGRAKIEGAEFGAENAPTKDQIQASIDSGEPLEIPGDKFTVYGQYARNASLTAVSDEIEYMVSAEISKTIKEFNASLDQPGSDPNYEPDKLLEKLTAIVEGHASALDDVSPGTARKLRASGGITANSKYVSYADKWSADAFKDKKSKMYAKFAIQDEELYDKIYAHAGNKEMLDFLIKTVKSNRLAEASTFGASQSELNTISTNFDSNLEKVARMVIQDEILKSDASAPGKMLEELIKGSESRNVSDAMNAGLNILERLGKSRRSIVKELINENTARINFEANQKQNDINNNVRSIKEAMGKAVTLWFQGKEEDAKDLMGGFIKANGGVIYEGTGEQVEKWAKFQQQQSLVEVKDDDKTVIRLENMGTNLTSDDVITKFNDGLLSKTTASGLINDAQKFADEKYKRAIKNVIHPAFQFNETVNYLDPKGKVKLNIELKNEAQSLLGAEYEQSLIDNTTQSIDWAKRASEIVRDLKASLEPEKILKEKTNGVKVITTILSQVKDPNLKGLFQDIKAETMTRDQVQTMLDTLMTVKGEIADPTPGPGYFGGEDPVPVYIRKLTRSFKNNTRLLDRRIETLKETLTLYD